MPESEALYPEETADSMPPDQDGESSESQDNREDKSKKKKSEPTTELVSKKLLHIGDDEMLEPGQEFTVKIVKDYGEEAEIECVKKKKESKDMSADEEIDQIDSKGY